MVVPQIFVGFAFAMVFLWCCWNAIFKPKPKQKPKPTMDRSTMQPAIVPSVLVRRFTGNISIVLDNSAVMRYILAATPDVTRDVACKADMDALFTHLHGTTITLVISSVLVIEIEAALMRLKQDSKLNFHSIRAAKRAISRKILSKGGVRFVHFDFNHKRYTLNALLRTGVDADAMDSTYVGLLENERASNTDPILLSYDKAQRAFAKMRGFMVFPDVV